MTKLDWEKAHRRAQYAKWPRYKRPRKHSRAARRALDKAYLEAEAEREAKLPPEVRRRKAKAVARKKKREKAARSKERERIERNLRQLRAWDDAAEKRAKEKRRKLGLVLKLVPDRSARPKRCFACGNLAPIGRYLPSEAGRSWRKCPACGMNFQSNDFDI